MKKNFTKKEEADISELVKNYKKFGGMSLSIKAKKTFLKTIGAPFLMFDKEGKRLINLFDEAERRYNIQKKVRKVS